MLIADGSGQILGNRIYDNRLAGIECAGCVAGRELVVRGNTINRRIWGGGGGEGKRRGSGAEGKEREEGGTGE